MRALAAIALTAALAAIAAPPSSTAAAADDRIWFAPGPGTIDLIRLFERPDEWRRSRALTSVFKFYQQHTQMPAPSIVGPNTYEALARAGVFRTVKQWGRKLALEVGAVKEFYCTPDARGMNEAIQGTVASIRAVEAAGGSVSYLAMDEPFLAGQAAVCGGPSMTPTADRLQVYQRGVTQASPSVGIGLIEAYPSFSPDGFDAMLRLLAARGVKPAFLHVDVDIRGLRAGRDDFARDMRRLQAISAEQSVPFGFIIWGYNGDADALYAEDAARLTRELANTFRWEDMPDHLVFQSWAVSSTGLLVTPNNLPEDRPYTHTQIVWSEWRRLLGQTGSSTGSAIVR
ncbi:MAG TPA: hypothetical protein VFK57_03625 [Vicinamibacterales bacterium]|nr:hypothetical protein [Vicinamibacterales bacterium]